MIFTRETNPSASYRTDGSPAHEWDYRDLRDALDRRTVALGASVPIPAFPHDPDRRAVLAYVNHGRWLWDCPICRSTYMAAASARGFCVNCWNAGAGWFPLAFPGDREHIERALDQRPDPAARNWRPGETVAELVGENLEHGIAA